MTGSSLMEGPPRSCLLLDPPGPASPCPARTPARHSAAPATGHLPFLSVLLPASSVACPRPESPRPGYGEGRMPGSPPGTNHWFAGDCRGSARLRARPPFAPFPAGGEGHRASHPVVHLVFERVGRRAEAGDFLHLQVDVGIDEVVAHHAAGLEEV